MAKKESPEKVDDVFSIKSSDEKMQLWKPEKVGERVEGKLMKISDSRFGKVLRLNTKKGVISIPVSTFLEDIDFTEYVDERLRFIFKGVAGRNMRLFDVQLLKPKDEVPF